MTRLIFSVIFIILIALLVRCIFFITKDQGEKTLNLRCMVFLSASMCLLELIFIYSQNIVLSGLLISLYSISLYWLLFNMVIFIQDYTQVFPRVKIFDRFFMIFGVIDAAVILTNDIHHQVFELSKTTFNGMVVYLTSNPKPFFYAHFVACVILGIFIILPMAIRGFSAKGTFKRTRYIPLFFISTFTLIVSFYITSYRFPVDLAAITYALTVMAIIYLTQNLIPLIISSHAQNLVVQNSDDGIIFYDVEGQILYENSAMCSMRQNKEIDKLLPKYLTALINTPKDGLSYSEIKIHADEKKIYNLSTWKLIIDGELIGYVLQFNDVTTEYNHRRQVYYQMCHDPLTGLYNYHFFCEKVQQFIQSHPSPSYYMVINDINGFKFYNSIFGREEGDKVLKRIAELLQAAAFDECVYGRISDDEFAMFVPEDKYYEDSYINYTNLIRQEFSNDRYRINVNVGVYNVTNTDETIDIMCDRAKLAISKTKDDYSKVLTYFENSMSDNVLNRQWIIDELSHALEDGQISMYLQPQVNSTTNHWIGAEALVRWIHPERGLISPATFIPVLEEFALITLVDQFIWEEAAKLLAKWKKIGRDDLYISVNVSGLDFYHTNLYDTFMGLVEKYDIDPKNIKIEITESVLVYSKNEKNDVLSKLRNAGFIIAVDDFGSGFSSLNSLKDAESDVIKIDMGFLEKTKNHQKSQSIFKDVARMIQNIGMDIVVEGVETKEQLDFVSQCGCYQIQGYYFARPMPAADFELELADNS